MRNWVFLLLVLGACEKSAPEETPDSDVGSFFSESLFDESVSAKDTEVKCEGASESEQRDLNHPSIIRGSVFAPPPQQSSWSIISRAHAVPIEGEVPRPGVVVTIGNDEKTWRETTTDPLGRFCLRLPFTGRFDADTVLKAHIDDDVLRRFAPTRDIAIISTQSEAVVRLASPLTPLSSAELINLQTMSDTRSDLKKPIAAGADIQSTVLRVQEELQSDKRIKDWIAKRMTSQ